MKTAYYTANVGGYDPNIINGAVLITDAPVKGNPRFKSRWIKLQPHKLFPDADYWVYIDANLSLRISVKELIKKYGGNFISARPHPTRKCIYDEILEVSRLGFDSPTNLEKLAKKIIKDEFPRDYGLWEHGLLIMKNTPETIKFLDEWWSFVKQYSRRDQLSGAYILWKNNNKFKPIPRNIINYNAHSKTRYNGGF